MQRFHCRTVLVKMLHTHTHTHFLWQYWFNEFATHRLEVDQTHYLSHSQQPQQRQEEEVMTGSGCGAVEMTGVDVGKILAAKPSREKRSVSQM